MPRFATVLAAVLATAATLATPAPAAADAPPPDRFTPCDGLAEGQACYAAGCTCVTVTDQGCPGGAATCLSCQTAAGGWCGPTNYHPRSDGAFGCSSAAPAGAAALGSLALVILSRRRRG